MTPRARVTWLVAAAVCAGCLAPRAAHAESVFALNLIGDRIELGDARSAALGGFVQLAEDSLSALAWNPAALAWCKRVTLGVSGYTTRDKNRSAGIEEVSVGTTVSAFVFAFPLYRDRLTFSLGYRGGSDADGEFSVPEQTDAGESYTSRLERTGGLWSVPFTLALDLGHLAKLGGYYTLERGSIQNRWIIDFSGASTADALSTQLREFQANGWGMGATLRPLPRLLLGITYQGGFDYNIETDETYTNASADTSYVESASMPPRWTGSATIRLARRLHLYLGGSIRDFTKFRGLSFPVERLAREQTVSIGFEYGRNASGHFPLRASATFEQLPYTMPDGENIRRVAFAVGTGLLFKSRKGKVDVALQFGKTGAVDSNGYADQFVRFYMSITGAEEWKKRRDTRY